MSEVQDLTIAVTGLREVAAELRDRSDLQDQVLARIEKLATDTAALANDAAALATQTKHLAEYGRKNRLGLQIGSIGIVLSLLAGSSSIYLFTKLNETTHQLSLVQSRTSTEVLCPLYQLFALSLTTNPTPPNYTTEQLELREQYKRAINDGLVKLGCPTLSK